jgi:hypothetical protein
MSLDKSKLAQALKDVFKSATENSLSSDQVADGIASAIDDYVVAAAVVGVNVDVVDNAGQAIGTGAQTGAGKLQ